jgi:3-oxoacyl-[acyl-carrier-protein] synthase-1
MSAQHVAILNAGLVTSVGLTAAASCAAFRAKVTNPTQTRYVDSTGKWILAHRVTLAPASQGLPKLAKMAALAIEETLQDVPKADWPDLPLLLCVAEKERPGRTDGLDDRLFEMIQDELGTRFASQSAVVTQGRVGVAVALLQSRNLLHRQQVARVLIVATDSLVTWPTLSHYQRAGRLLTESNSNGFMPGEGAGALLLGTPQGAAGELVCTGIGFGREAAHIDSEEPLRGDGLAQAIRDSLTEADCQMHHMDFRVTDLSGEHYYFKEATLALSRVMRTLKAEFDIWHPAECTGEVGALSGVTVLVAARQACAKGYAKGPNVLAHWSNDAGQRAAVTLQHRRPT